MSLSGVPCEALLAFGRCGVSGCPYNHDRDMLEMVFPEAEGWRLVPRSSVVSVVPAPAPLEVVVETSPPPAMAVRPASLPCENILCFGECRDKECPYNHDRVRLRELFPDAVGLQESPSLTSSPPLASLPKIPVPIGASSVRMHGRQSPVPTPQLSTPPPQPREVDVGSIPCENILAYGRCNDGPRCVFNHNIDTIRAAFPGAPGFQPKCRAVGGGSKEALPKQRPQEEQWKTTQGAAQPARKAVPIPSEVQPMGPSGQNDRRAPRPGPQGPATAATATSTEVRMAAGGNADGSTAPMIVVMDSCALVNAAKGGTTRRLSAIPPTTRVYIPRAVVMELEGLQKKGKADTMAAAKAALLWIAESAPVNNLRPSVSVQTKEDLTAPFERQCDGNDDFIVAYANYVQSQEQSRANTAAPAESTCRPVYLCTDDRNMRLKAFAENLAVLESKDLVS